MAKIENYSSCFKVYTVGELTARLLHKLNNMLCIVNTNLEMMLVRGKKGYFNETAVKETKQALKEFQDVVESFTILLRSDDYAGKSASLTHYFGRLNVLIEKKIITGVNFEYKIPEDLFVSPKSAVDVLFSIIGMIQFLKSGFGENDDSSVSVSVTGDNLLVKFYGRVEKHILKNVIAEIESKDKDLRGVLLSSLLAEASATHSISDDGQGMEIMTVVFPVET